MANKRKTPNLFFPQGKQDTQFWQQVKMLDELGEQMDDLSSGLSVTLHVNGEEEQIPFVRFSRLISSEKKS